ncbi:unnamed protein product [Hermetia illucens]|uniref:Uncharacterized protein n=2 Tax=Hermetia illucens TaxID=343691 RepID=A0A7R8UQG7_HERIL|nr:unnamed protein product [Hermetia illucens]
MEFESDNERQSIEINITAIYVTLQSTEEEELIGTTTTTATLDSDSDTLLVNQTTKSILNIVDDVNLDGISTDELLDATETLSVVLVLKCFVISFIILAAIFGNMLVIVSVMRHRKLR